MTHSKASRSGAGGWNAIKSWSVKAPLLVIAFVLGVLHRPLHLNDASIVAGLTMVLAVIGFRGLWNQPKFWALIVLLAVIQVVVILRFRLYEYRWGIAEMLAFWMLDFVLIASAILVVCSRKSLPHADNWR